MKKFQADVCVVAAGLSGLAASIAAAEQGLKVVTLEKNKVTGGAASMGMGPLAVGSRLQRMKGVNLTADEAFLKHMHYAHWMADARLVYDYYRKTGDTIDWLEDMGIEVSPAASETRYDIIQEAILRAPKKLVAFCKGIQAAAPVDSYVTPEPWDMPGYGDQVIMAAGAFVSGSSIELSADGPLREPYSVFFQGGLTWPHGKFGILKACQELSETLN